MTVDQARLLAEARSAAAASYSPYSRFRVGAAVAAGGGTVVRGANVENASYGLGMCAERVAVFAAVAAGHRELVAVAVACPDGDGSQPETLMPCGACRQVMAEFLAPGALVLVDGVGTFALDELLPRPFRLA